MNFYQVKNWEKFQHYKDRTPPWIKLHFELFSSTDWVMLADASKLLMIVCMMIASRNEGQVPADAHYLKRVAYLDKVPDLTPLLKCGFLINPLADASTMQADASTMQADASTMQADARPETYSKEADKKDIYPEFEILWKKWPAKRRCEKPKAKDAWKDACKKSTPAEILSGLEKYLATEEVKTGYAPYPAKWLKSERWNEFESDKPQIVSDETRAANIQWKIDRQMFVNDADIDFLENQKSKHEAA